MVTDDMIQAIQSIGHPHLGRAFCTAQIWPQAPSRAGVKYVFANTNTNTNTNTAYSYLYLYLIKFQTMYLYLYLYLIHRIWCIWQTWWRHNGRDSVSNHQPHDCLLNRLFRRRSKQPSKLRVTGLCVGNSPGAGELPAQMASNAENVSYLMTSSCIASSLIDSLAKNTQRD